jgi:predicted transcriptional regulator
MEPTRRALRSVAKFITLSDVKDGRYGEFAVTSFQKASNQAASQVFETGAIAQAPIAASDTVFSDGIVCLIDGQKKRNLRKWLVLQYGMTPDEYRRLYNLPADYPMSVSKELSTPSAKVVEFRRPEVIASPRFA